MIGKPQQFHKKVAKEIKILRHIEQEKIYTVAVQWHHDSAMLPTISYIPEFMLNPYSEEQLRQTYTQPQTSKNPQNQINIQSQQSLKNPQNPLKHEQIHSLISSQQNSSINYLGAEKKTIPTQKTQPITQTTPLKESQKIKQKLPCKQTLIVKNEQPLKQFLPSKSIVQVQIFESQQSKGSKEQQLKLRESVQKEKMLEKLAQSKVQKSGQDYTNLQGLSLLVLDYSQKVQAASLRNQVLIRNRGLLKIRTNENHTPRKKVKNDSPH